MIVRFCIIVQKVVRKDSGLNITYCVMKFLNYLRGSQRILKNWVIIMHVHGRRVCGGNY